MSRALVRRKPAKLPPIAKAKQESARFLIAVLVSLVFIILVRQKSGQMVWAKPLWAREKQDGEKALATVRFAAHSFDEETAGSGLAVSLLKPRALVLSTRQICPGSIGCRSHRLRICESGLAVGWDPFPMGPRSYRFCVKGGHMSPNVPQCRPMSP